MRTYLYDGSFDGLLTAYFYAYADRDVYTVCPVQTNQPNLLAQPISVATENDKAARIKNAVQKKLPGKTMLNLYQLYLSELPDCDLLGLRYLRLCFTKGPVANQAKQNPIIRQVDDYCYKVRKELDHIKGFLRFQQIAPLTFYACFAPDHNQLPLLQTHLERRFSDQRMIVHDEKRHYALVYNLRQSVMVPFTKADANTLLQDSQDDCIALFRQYFQAINIPERKNLRLQAQYMPHRYRRYMPETQQPDH